MSDGSFTRSLKRFVKLAEVRSNEVVRKVALGVLANVVTASPVDTGRFRGNWQAGLGAAPTGEMGPDKDAGSVVSREAQTIEQAELGKPLFIVNNLPYGLALEYGSSKQAPNGMVRRTLASLKSIVEEASK